MSNHTEESKAMTLSAQQEAIVCEVAQGNNVSVDAVAGSGKTTVLIHCAKRTGKKTLILTYSKSLQQETWKKIRDERLDKKGQSDDVACIR